jgi:hypothetical protein
MLSKLTDLTTQELQVTSRQRLLKFRLQLQNHTKELKFNATFDMSQSQSVIVEAY